MKRIFALLLTLVLLASSGAALAAGGYTDVPDSHWAAASIQSAKTYGLMSGMTSNTFGLGQTITRAQFVTVISVYLFPTLRRVKNPSCSRSSRIDKSVVRLSWHSSARYVPEKANCPAFSSSPR